MQCNAMQYNEGTKDNKLTGCLPVLHLPPTTFIQHEMYFIYTVDSTGGDNDDTDIQYNNTECSPS